jgi:hypothetical protein
LGGDPLPFGAHAYTRMESLCRSLTDRFLLTRQEVRMSHNRINSHGLRVRASVRSLT